MPEALADEAAIGGIDGARIWGDASAEEIHRLVRVETKAGMSRVLLTNAIAISGGAEDGAYGSGLLVGWTAAGTRPKFDLVTGVSAGGLIAPFAFLGPHRDAQLKEVFTKYGLSDIVTPNILSGLLGGSAVADSTPLANLIARYVDREFMRELAAERRKGRVLLIGTTNLDAQRPVLWDIGRIAMSNEPYSLDLIRKVLLASSSIPGAFPPVRITVHANGKTYDELHADGGVTQQVFLMPTSIGSHDMDELAGRAPSRHLYVIRNAKTNALWEPVEERTLALAQRSISTLIKYQGLGDLYRIYGQTKQIGMSFSLATIPADFDVKADEPFDLKYMHELFSLGYRQARSGYPWQELPPGLTAEQSDVAAR